MGLIRRLRVTQGAMERAMLVVCLRDQIRNKEIRKRIRVTDIAQLVAKLSGNGRGQDGCWGPKVLAWRTLTGKSSVDRPLTRWTDEIKRVAGSLWTQAAQNCCIRKSLQWT
ncbi:jg8481 [Pararge aegeria aegeria]|uniref:Jg8481 protein n=1 Tax=Pararge aegeria aegeria TaxID=348720 RepID=A0A8S4RZR4_9NEOP|nr:jg8481 [Pararge aegeria aegeria]